MKLRITLLPFLLLVSAVISFSQPLQKVMIGKTGVSISSYCKMNFDMSRSPDSSIVYNGECMSSQVNYGVICVKLLNSRTNLDDATQLVGAYLDYLRKSFNITHADANQQHLRLNKDENTRGMSENWSDAENNIWVVRGWTNGKFLVVLYTNSRKPVAASRIDPFLNGLSFPK